MRIDDKVILLTGAGGGIGSALAQRLADAGARLVLTCAGEESLARLAEALGPGHRAVSADIASEEGRARILEACTDAGGIDALINLAGVMDFNLFESQSSATIDRTLLVNLLAPMQLCRAALPALASRPQALVLNVGSIFGSIGHPGFVAYCASKAGLEAFSEALGRELADSSVRVAYIAPRATATALNPDRLSRMNRVLGNKCDAPDYVAGEIVAMIRGKARARYLGWPEKFFVRLNALLPSVVHRALVKNLEVIKHYASS